jgi:hypothetical protein
MSTSTSTRTAFGCKKNLSNGESVLTDLIRNKRASGRTKDIADAEALEELRDHQPHERNK